MIAETLLALITHVQLLPALTQNYDVDGAVLYTEIPPSTRLSLKVTHSDLKGNAVTVRATWRF